MCNIHRETNITYFKGPTMKVICECCNKEFQKQKTEVQKTRANFCSRSCAAKVNNRKFPKRSKANLEALICECGRKKDRRSKSCANCLKEKLSNKTKGDFLYSNSTNVVSKWVRVRENARTVARNNHLYELGCKFCGYSKHVEIAHIKPINEFDNNAKISEINDISNLIQLCPNCHWEFDNLKCKR
jgi:hypothetical protein